MEYNLFLYKATVYDVYDGDTFKANVDLGFGISVKMVFRVLGIDTPEVRGESRSEGLKSRDVVRGLILNREVIIESHRDKTEKYGRYLATVYLEDGRNLSTILIESGLAVEYSQNKKIKNLKKPFDLFKN